MSTSIDETGKRHGKLVVLSRVGTRDNNAMWRCQCDCGGMSVVAGNSLRRGNTRSCGCLNVARIRSEMPADESAFNNIRRSTKLSATVRNLEWSISDELLRVLTVMHCHYCGAPPGNTTTTRSRTKWTGLDRVDNSIGYIPSNVVPCCQFCNYAKRNWHLSEFLGAVERIHAHQLKGKQ